MLDPELKDFVTPRQWEFLEAIEAHGSRAKAAEAMGVNIRTLQRSADSALAQMAKRGHAPGHWNDGVAPGYRMGKVTVQRGPEGVERVWERQHPEDEDRAALIQAFVEAMCEEVRGLAPSEPPPADTLADLLAVYAFGDPHFGMYAWADETGEDFDLETADRLTRAGIDRMTAVAPEAETAILLFIGDNTHADNSKNATPESGHALDVDTRHSKVMLTTARATIYAARRALERHQRVILWFMRGNHDPETAQALAIALSLYFENEPRIEVSLDPSLYRYHRHGKVLIGAHHGHGAKQQDLPLLMAVDRPEDWGQSMYRYVYMGHIHHDSVKEVQGVRVESIRTLAAKDAWHAGKGYRSMRDTRVIVHHKDFGEVERHTCSLARLEAA